MNLHPDIYVIIFAHERPEMLSILLEEIRVNVILPAHPTWNGRKLFWKKWERALELFECSEKPWFLSLPDDVSKVDVQRINNFVENHSGNIALNMINDGRVSCWGKYSTGYLENGFIECGYVDCGFLATREVMHGVTVSEPPKKWWNRSNKSSGVGYQLTMSLRKKFSVMLIPVPTIVQHGNHPSVMHEAERINHPIITK